MKLKIVCCLVLFLQSFSAFSACEYERERADRARELCLTWCKVSGTTAAVGSIASAVWSAYETGGLEGAKNLSCGSGFKNSWGGLAGLAPGVVAWRLYHLAHEKENSLRECLKQDAILEVRKQEEARIEQLKSVAKMKAQIIGQLAMKKKAEYQLLAEREFDEFLKALVDSDLDLSDPSLLEELETERARINSQYF